MSALPSQPSAGRAAAVRVEAPTVSPPAGAEGLGDLLAAFNDVTAQLQATHTQLHAEVARLRGELREANEALQRSKRLAALGEMAAGIAHEVRNPLGSIKLYAEMLAEDLGDRPSEQEHATKIAGAVRAADAIVTDVLHFSRELRVDPMLMEAPCVFERALDACADLRAGVRISGGLGEGVEVLCDAQLVHQAMVNLIRNALEAMAGDAGGALTLDAERRACHGGDEVALVVRDDGPGVTPEVVDRMFNPFFTTRATGTGLGLAIVHRIADAHGGRVEVRNNQDNDPGARGARVELVLPAPAGERAERPTDGAEERRR